MSSLSKFKDGTCELPLTCKIGILLTAVLLLFCAIGIPLLITPSGKNFGEVTEDCGTVMSMKSRQNLLYWHNKYRSLAAKGEYKITTEQGKFRELPPAKRMPQLKYNCSLEISSLKWANIAQCEMKHSTYPGVGENLFATSGDVTQEEAADTATKPWADEIANYGISAMNEYRSAIGHATQVLWAETLTVGCAVTHCTKEETTLVHRCTKKERHCRSAV
ncbi:hypothetical protein RB195_002160 [Necator americanus]|uniref:SCP domain-containing protein n=1 Tax=Necator americanus TaxID=51031 RepID=A0ABR1DIF2_NECAM